MSDSASVIEEYYTHLKNRDREKLLALLSPDIEITYHSQPEQFPWSGKFRGIEGFDRFFSILKDYLEVVEVNIVHSTTTDDTVINQCEGRWKFKQSGFVVAGDMVNVFRVSRGKISAYEVYADTAEFAKGFQTLE